MEKTTQQDTFHTPPEVFRTPSSRAERITKSLPPSSTRFRYTPLGMSATDSTSLRRQRAPQFTTPSTETSTMPRTTLSRSTTFCSDAGDESTNTPWSRMEWKKLEHYYIKNNRDYKRAGESFYMNESLIRVDDGSTLEEKWTKEHCIWRSQCLDTNAKFNHGLLPSERKKKKKQQLQQEQSKRQPQRQELLSRKK